MNDKYKKSRLPAQRWRITPVHPEKISELILSTGLLPLVNQTIVNRGIDTPELAQIYIEPESQNLPSPLSEFKDLAASIQLLQDAIACGEKIAICGDYDADGMTSTALLLRAFRHLGADVDYAIPSRIKDGYGINIRIVEEFAASGVGLILTVDNGISAYEPILRATELGLSVIVTDHHDIPEKLPPADAILNPKLLPETSPYRGLAGVGVAYVLAVATAQSLGKLQGLTNQLLELFTLGTIADLAPLVGVNRRWLKRGLRQLPNSELAGVQALIQMAGVKEEQKQLQPDDIGFKLGPRINAVGRIGDPQIVIELLTTDDLGVALERAMQCEQINRQRQHLCEQIEQEAIALIETIHTSDKSSFEKQNEEKLSSPILWQEARVLVLVQENWHHGVIGIVASRLVERYGVPTFIGTYEEEDKSKIRGSARGIEEFHVFDALEFCQDLLGKFGGHKAAGGFSLPAQNLRAFQQRLSEFACKCLKPEYLKPLIKIDAEAKLERLSLQLYKQIDSLQPWGIGNDFPVFWTPNVRIKEQQIVGKNHLKLTLTEDDSEVEFKAIAWRWGEYFPLPNRLDLAYKLRENHWNGNANLELEIVGVRLPQFETITEVSPVKSPVTEFSFNGRSYTCSLLNSSNELKIINERGKVLIIGKGKKIGVLGVDTDNSQEVDVTKPPYYQLVKAALEALKYN